MWNNIKTIQDEKEHVTKYVFSKNDRVAEAVLYRYPTYQERTVICCSTQSGCPVGCRFCGAGDYFVRSLTADEIVSQVDQCIKDTSITAAEMNKLQVMFMSMGEPMLNYKQLEQACRVLYYKYPNARLLISTIGPQVDFMPLIDLSILIPTIGLQFSIHESTDETRNKLIPYKMKFNLGEIASIGYNWWKYTGRKPYFNYCAHEKNSSKENVNHLLELFHPDIWCATVSVICERNEQEQAKNDVQRNLAVDFASKLVESGYDTRVFDPAGQDTIGGGCGQLWFVQNWMKNHPDLAKPSIGHGKEMIHTPR